MLRTVTTRLELAIDGRTNMVFSIAAAQDAYFGKESLSFVLDGVPLKATELVDDHGTRLHQLVSDAGTMVVEYSAEVVGRANPLVANDIDLVMALSLLESAREEAEEGGDEAEDNERAAVRNKVNISSVLISGRNAADQITFLLVSSYGSLESKRVRTW